MRAKHLQRISGTAARHLSAYRLTLFPSMIRNASSLSLHAPLPYICARCVRQYGSGKAKKAQTAMNEGNEKKGAGTPISKLLGSRTLQESLQPRGTLGVQTERNDADESFVELLKVEGQPKIRRLHHGLDRVLFNPGVVFLQDPRSHVYNFDPDLQRLAPVTDFDFDAVASYITSSQDVALLSIARQKQRRYMGSTSSMTAVLSHFHYLLSAWRSLNIGSLSKSFETASLKSFTQITRAPASIFLRYKGDGAYAIDADKEFDTDNVLSLLGHSMEKLLTLPPSGFKKYLKTHSHTLEPEARNVPETYHYSTFGDFLMRSQLDAQDSRLPGHGIFDLKSRAVASVRMDVQNFHLGCGYQIRTRFGEWESFEREYFDMIRAAFLKYSLQVRMGAMDGIFVTFHNTETIFGFQYISLDEMDAALHGGPDTRIGDKEFRLSLRLLNQLLNRATQRFPERSLRLSFETRETLTPLMYVVAEPLPEDKIDEIQRGQRSELKDFLNELRHKLHLAAAEIREGEEHESGATSSGQEVQEPSKLPEDSRESEEGLAEEIADEDQSELLAMTLMVQNFVNGEQVVRPPALGAEDKWEIEYTIGEFKSRERALTVSKAIRARTQKMLGREEGSDNDDSGYIKNLRLLSKSGRKWQQEQKAKYGDKEKVVFESYNPC